MTGDPAATFSKRNLPDTRSKGGKGIVIHDGVSSRGVATSVLPATIATSKARDLIALWSIKA